MVFPAMEVQIPFEMLRQPNDTTCGPTCLHAVYSFYGDTIPLEQVISEVGMLQEGGTLAVFLGLHALKRGYEATIYTFNMQVFDTTWFKPGAPPLAECLEKQLEKKASPRLSLVTPAYIEFLNTGGSITMEVLNGNFVRKFLKKETPILTGLSSTYLYQEPRERCPDAPGTKCVPDSIAGVPQGHFVVLCGYDSERREVLVADPLFPNPLADRHIYPQPVDRVLSAILLGILTNDANILVIRPRKAPDKKGKQATEPRTNNDS